MANGQGLIKARRRLNELFKTGVEIRFGGRYGLDGAVAPAGEGYFLDDEGRRIPLGDDEVAMWVQPPSPMQRDMALRNANAARSRASLHARKNPDSEENLAAQEFVDELDEDQLYEYLLIAKNDDRQQEAIREILAEEEWADLTEMQDSIRIFNEEGRPDDDPEVMLIAERERELQIQVTTREEELRDASRDVLRMRGPENARKQAIEHHIEVISSRSFMLEYERQMTFYSVRDVDDTGVIFFESASELAHQPDAVLDLIQDGLSAFIRDGAEAKNSQRAELGSDSSVPPSKSETSEASTPEAVPE